MPIYNYTATNIRGKKEYGMIEASDEERLHEVLKEKGLFLLSCKEHVEKKAKPKLKVMELADFCRQIGSLLSAGIDLARSLQVISQRDVKKHIREIYNEINLLIRQGVPLSDAMEEQEVFPELLVNMIRASESSGTLEKTTLNMAEHYEKEQKLRSKITASTFYPIILLALTVISTFVLFVFVVPKFTEIYEGMDLPLPTRIILGFSSFITNNLLMIFISLLAFIFILSIGWRFKEVQIWFDKMKLSMPVTGKLLKIVYTARFARTLSSLYSSGIPIVRCMNIAKNTIQNRYISSQFDGAIERIKNGETLSSSIGTIEGFDIKLVSTISVGEETGRLNMMLEATASSMEYEAEAAMQKMTTFLGPVLVIILAIIILFVVLAVMLPMVGFYSQLEAGV